MIRCASCFFALLSLLICAAPASADEGAFVLGVMNDQSGPYADLAGPGSVQAARMAIEDFGGSVLGKKIELLVADHQNKVDVGAAIAREWYDARGVEVIFDITNSGVALALQDLAKARHKLVIFDSASSSDLTGKACSPNGFQWNADNWSNGVSLMRLLIKELEPTSGTIRVAGHDLRDIERKRVPFYRRNIGVVFQDFKLLPSRTVHDNVAYALQVTGGTRKEIRAKVPDILRLTGLSLKLHSYPDQLSGGEQQRVSIARAFVNHPSLLLADEPTGNLDPETSIDIMRLLYRINRTGTTVLVATHDQAMVDKMRRRVIELSEGQIVRDEATGLYTRDESTREFARRMRSPATLPPGIELDPPAEEGHAITDQGR